MNMDTELQLRVAEDVQPTLAQAVLDDNWRAFAATLSLLPVRTCLWVLAKIVFRMLVADLKRQGRRA